MGWDANSSVELEYEPVQIKDQKLRKLFNKTAEEIIETTGSVDGYFYFGSLDVSTCRNMLQEATNESCYDDWSEEKVKELHNKANWNFKYEQEDYWAYESAKEFLRLCSENNLSIQFSY